MNRRRFVGLMGHHMVAALVGMPLVRAAGATAGPGVNGLIGEYGFLSPAVLAVPPEEAIRARVATMARDYGVRDFQFCERRQRGRQHRLACLIVGDGARRMKTEYWPDTVALSEAENACLREGVTSSRQG